jgi:hypothetical protein
VRGQKKKSVTTYPLTKDLCTAGDEPKENTSLLLGGDFGPLRVGSMRMSIHKC